MANLTTLTNELMVLIPISQVALHTGPNRTPQYALNAVCTKFPITPIPKIGKDPKHPSSYTPIALTSTLCKIMECIIVNRLNWYCNKDGMFNKYQSGFRSGRSTYDHLLRFHDMLNKELRNKGKALAVFIDIEKVYDMERRSSGQTI